MDKNHLVGWLLAVILLTGCSSGKPTTPATAGLPAVTAATNAAHRTPVRTSVQPRPTDTLTPTKTPTSAEVPAAVAPTRPASSAREYTCSLAGTNLPVEIFEVVNRYPHDPDAYTQGLIVRHGWLYESTGLRGYSSLRKVELETGKVIQKKEIPDQYFGEGITELNGRIYQLTWQEFTGFIFQLEDFSKIGEFSIPTEGWGLTDDGSRLIMSDGSDRLYFIDPLTLQVAGEVSVADDRGPVYRINELEFVDGQVLGNIYQTACIARIDPTDGRVLGWIDLSGLYEIAAEAAMEKPALSEFTPEVPNGIAYDASNNRLLVTGKFWPTLFEIRLHPAKDQP